MLEHLLIYMPRNGIAGSSGSTMSNFLRNHQTDFQSVWFSLQSHQQSHQQWKSVTLSPHPRQHVLSPEFFILTGVRWNLKVVLICISLMAKDVEHFFKCFSAIWDSYNEKSLCSVLPHFKKKEIFMLCMISIIVLFRHTRRGHQIPLQMVVSHHVVAGNWTQYLWKSSQCS